jgi:hypothetical protein
MYANRLIRCYLGASRLKTDSQQPRNSDDVFGEATGVNKQPRSPNYLTGFDPKDDYELSYLQRRNHQGPLYLINTALNLAKGEELAWHERKAESFVMTPYYCGSTSTGYCSTAEYAGKIKVGTAVALSGAAANPNMGFYTNTTVSILLTLFNVRMGAWLGNPRDKEARNKPSPPEGLGYLFKEMFTQTSARSSYVQISDGGHFENLGIYELIRRRVKFIVLSDGGADPSFILPCLGNMIRKVRVDFGIRIELDVEALRPQGDRRQSASHVVVGRIRYSDVKHKAEAPVPEAGFLGRINMEFNPAYDYDSGDGIIVLLKPNFTGDESPDLLNYRTQNPTFPHETTADQFYSESQFESYRALGFHSVISAFEAVRKPGKPFESIGGIETKVIFKELYDAWFNKLRAMQPIFFEFNATYLELQKRLGSDPLYTMLEQEINGEVPEECKSPVKKTTTFSAEEQQQMQNATLTPEEQRQVQGERTMVIQMLTLLENVFFGLNFRNEWEFESNLGWKGVYTQWFKSPIFREHYMQVQNQFSKEFRTFIVEHALLLHWEKNQAKYLEKQLVYAKNPKEAARAEAVGNQTVKGKG